ncbi:hypothetical protein GDO86_013964 [Hymenochirus boettgeri]|uniref:Fatty acid desaturase domain-containing protein n=1 Tax=Hymenochirus boettgeri TaxID=247094 RepID=A0A8T2JSJ9_9PIPI|nr:hypothetical protein GDO86_013964 [Hymenochirus boettgeri]
MDEMAEKITSEDVNEQSKEEMCGVKHAEENMSLRERTLGNGNPTATSDTSQNNNCSHLNLNGLRSSTEEERDEGKLLLELSKLVWEEWRCSSWWERHGVDWTIIGLAMCSLPAGSLCLGSSSLLFFVLGILILGLANSVITIKGSHMASHRALCRSPTLGRFWATFFIEICSWLPVQYGEQGHVKIHHKHTNIIGLGDSRVWKAPCLNYLIYMFLAPLALPVLTLVIGLRHMMQMSCVRALGSLFCISLGLWGHLQFLVQTSGLSLQSALGCMFISRSLMAVPFIHVNIFQHIGLPMFSPSERPHRLKQMSYAVLNLHQNLLLDWTFGHSLISCHVEHHLFPAFSDHMCLKVKPIVSSFLCAHNLPYKEDTYMSRLRLFLNKYEEFMVLAPPITKLVELN